MKLSKNQLRMLIVAAILLIAFNVITLVPPIFAKTSAFWIAWVFGNLAILLQIPVMLFLAFPDGNSAKSRFYGFPIARFSVIYLVVQLILSIVFMALAAVCPTWIPLVVFILLLAAGALGVIATDVARDEVVRQDVETRKDVNTMRSLQTIGAGLAAECPDGEAADEIKKLADQLRYSDPVSSEALADVEMELTKELDELLSAVKEGNTDKAAELAKEAQKTLAERNRLCKLNK